MFCCANDSYFLLAFMVFFFSEFVGNNYYYIAFRWFLYKLSNRTIVVIRKGFSSITVFPVHLFQLITVWHSNKKRELNEKKTKEKMKEKTKRKRNFIELKSALHSSWNFVNIHFKHWIPLEILLIVAIVQAWNKKKLPWIGNNHIFWGGRNWKKKNTLVLRFQIRILLKLQTANGNWSVYSLVSFVFVEYHWNVNGKFMNDFEQNMYIFE